MIDQQLLDNRLSELAGQFKNGNVDVTAYTEGIKVLFAKIFEDDNFCCYANKINKSNHHLFYDTNEFVFDFSATQISESTHPLVRTVSVIKTFLAMETEMDSFNCVVEDFQKLLQSNADEKVMVFRCHSSEFDGLADYLEFNLRNYQGGNGLFHLIALLNDRRTFIRRTTSA